MSVQTATERAQKQILDEAKKQLEALVRSWAARATNLSKKGYAIHWKHVIQRTPRGLTLLIDLEPSEWSVIRLRGKIRALELEPQA